MKYSSGTTLALFGMFFSIFGLTILKDFHIINYVALALGFTLAIIGVYLELKTKK
ncbi:hypothetical protein [Aquimarina sp. SS2-1]|uniref:hypothetical protein n=1 Tax=Aquimarina besae TaxID=3342247 RepID=UPI003671C763